MKSGFVFLSVVILLASCHKKYDAPSPEQSKHGNITTNDFAIASYKHYPDINNWAMLAFEDNWPTMGDNDMNDLVVKYHYAFGKNKAGNIISISCDVAIMASGASFHNGLGIEFPFAASLVKSVTGQRFSQKTYIQQNSNGTEAGSDKAIVIAFDNHELLLHYPSYAYFINVYPDRERITGDTAHLIISFDRPITETDLGEAPFNPFLISDGRRGYEVHLAGHKPTVKANTALLGAGDDNSLAGTYYTSKNKFPWALNFANSNYNYLVEQQDISKAYLHYADWIRSGRTAYGDWYTNKAAGYRDDSKIFK